MEDETRTLYERLGGERGVERLSERFYDIMERDEEALTALHPRDAEGRITREARDRFALFLIGWLGGPQEYMRRHGHPRLRMRHGHLPVDVAMRDAWVRCMTLAMEEEGVESEARRYLEQRFLQVADFMRNLPEQER